MLLSRLLRLLLPERELFRLLSRLALPFAGAVDLERELFRLVLPPLARELGLESFLAEPVDLRLELFTELGVDFPERDFGTAEEIKQSRCN